MSFKLFLFFLFHIFNLINSTPSNADSPPNIIVIMMDDLGFTDTSLNSGTFRMKTLDELARNGIKLNYHYSNTLCSASRSSLLTGRYAWRTGVVDIVKPLTLQHTNLDLPFISEVLKESDASYRTAMYGKYHLGYSSLDHLPFNRGFDKTLFFEAGASQYSSHLACNPWFWALQTIDIESQLETLLMSKFIDGFCAYDLWDEGYNTVENKVYSEKLFTDNIIQYIDEIANTDDDDDGGVRAPFFIYYAMQTPHWPLEYPPNVYKECEDRTDRKSDRKVFCNALLYGDEMIGRIVNNLKKNDLYQDTVIVFLSDNGPNTNWANKGYGETLPLRGAKGSTFEGGIRTPALISGGYVETNCDSIGRSYNDIVHISDWFAMLKYIGGIQEDDIDIDGINLWPRICNNDMDSVKRDNIIHFAMNDVDDIDEGFGPSYIRTDTWKLVVNGALRSDGNVAYKYWVNFDNEFKTNPPRLVYESIIERDDEDLYISTCYAAYIDFRDMFYPIDFGYDEIMLFKINEDKIEACNVAQYYPTIVQRLYDELFSDDNIEQHRKYEIYKATPSKVGTLAQIESYDCDTKKAYRRSWQELQEYDIERVKDRTWDNIFYSYVDTVDACNMRHRNRKDVVDEKDDHQFIVASLFMVSVILGVVVMLRYYLNYRKGLKQKGIRTGTTSDVTPLLSIVEE